MIGEKRWSKSTKEEIMFIRFSLFIKGEGGLGDLGGEIGGAFCKKIPLPEGLGSRE